jgi:hypothetical protein
MKKVFHFENPREQYVCDAAIVWCFDNRFELGFRKYLKRIGVMYSDPIKIAGGAKCLASPNKQADRDFVLDQIRQSIRLHETRRVILMVHSDCGAYGGLGAFHGDAAVEAEHLRRELHKAAEVVRREIPELHVEAYFVDFNTVWQADLAADEAPPTSLTAASRSPV